MEKQGRRVLDRQESKKKEKQKGLQREEEMDAPTRRGKQGGVIGRKIR